MATAQYGTNYAVKFSPKVQESFAKHSYTDAAVNHNVDFVGVRTVKLYDVGTARMQNYGMNTGIMGSNNSRYGTVDELTTNIQELQMNMDRSFTFVVDKRENMDEMGILNPGTALKRQINQVVVPEVDKYRFAKILNEVVDMDTKASSKLVHVKSQDEAISPSNAYTRFLDAKIGMLNKGVPMEGTFAFITTEFYKMIRLDTNFIKASDIAQNMLIKGQVGMVDGIPLVLVPDTYFVDNSNKGDALFTGLSKLSSLFKNSSSSTTQIKDTNKFSFMLVNKEAIVAAEKLQDYKVHDNPPGINGWLVEGRLYYDCFVLKKKLDMIHIEYTTPSA